MSTNTEKKFDKFFVANLKRTAQMVSPMVREKEKLLTDIEEKTNRVAVLDSQIESLDGHIRKVCGYGVEELVARKVVETGKTDKDGKPVRITKWELKYPETIVPIIENPVSGESEKPSEPVVMESPAGETAPNTSLNTNLNTNLNINGQWQ